MLDHRMPYWVRVGPQCAWGSGGTIALVAMMLGKTAVEAVEVASRLDPHTGGEVDSVTVHDAIVPIRVHKPGADEQRVAAVWLKADGSFGICGFDGILQGCMNVMAKPMSALYLIEGATSGPSLSFIELRTGPHETEAHAHAELRSMIGAHLEAHGRGVIHWRVLPEISSYYHYDECETRWKGYARFVVLPTETARRGIVVHKPGKYASDSNDRPGGYWLDECDGRLVLDTGCGHCLRCNREWFALSRNAHTLVPNDVGGYHPDAIQLDEAGVKRALSFDSALTAAEIDDGVALQSAMHPAWPNGLGVDPAPQSPMFALEAWVMAFNEASTRQDAVTMRKLDAELRSMEFPPGVELVTDVSGPNIQRRIIRRAAEKA
jgi:hypothetical protein